MSNQSNQTQTQTQTQSNQHILPIVVRDLRLIRVPRDVELFTHVPIAIRPDLDVIGLTTLQHLPHHHQTTSSNHIINTDLTRTAQKKKPQNQIIEQILPCVD
jgi:hypothetical protein